MILLKGNQRIRKNNNEKSLLCDKIDKLVQEECKIMSIVCVSLFRRSYRYIQTKN